MWLGGAIVQDILDKYNQLGKLGAGNFGNVYKVYNKIINRLEAIKIIPIDHGLGSRTTLEARAQHKLQHQNVTNIYDAFIKNDKLYISMEYLDGGTVQSLIEKDKRLSAKKAIKIAINCLHGLQYVHNNNYIHRDIKPNNILLDLNGIAKLSDFGLADELDSEGKFKSGFGYNIHKAPEILTRGEASRLSDIFAFGLTLYRMVNGDEFLATFNRTDIPHYIIRGDFPPKSSFSSHVPKKLKQVILKMLELDPTDRYPNIHSIRSDLGNIIIPIDWELVKLTNKKQVWNGTNGHMKYQLEVTKKLFKNEFNMILRKGHNDLKKVSKFCVDNIPGQKLDKQIEKVLTSKL